MTSAEKPPAWAWWGASPLGTWSAAKCDHSPWEKIVDGCAGCNPDFHRPSAWALPFPSPLDLFEFVLVGTMVWSVGALAVAVLLWTAS